MAARSSAMRTATPRMYSFRVRCLVKYIGSDRTDSREAALVAAGPQEALETAQRILAPQEAPELVEWSIAAATEIGPDESRVWANWHANALKE